MFAEIPSPSSGTIEIGPLSIHAYGLMIALGVVAGVWMLGRRFEQRGVGTRDDASAIALWAVIAGVIGARIYHVITDWSSFEDDLGKIPLIWKGGLGIPGGMLAGVAVGLWQAKKRGISPAVGATCVAPALPLAQAIGRWGNWFNQELFGKATDLPWALEVSDDKTLGAGYPPGTTFHPTFLYESIWNFALVGALLLVDKRMTRLRPGVLFALYVIGYGVGRFWVEGLRIDPAHELAGLRLNQWTSVAAIVLAIGWILWASGRPVDTAVLATAGEGAIAGAGDELRDPLLDPDDGEPGDDPDDTETCDDPGDADPAGGDACDADAGDSDSGGGDPGGSDSGGADSGSD